MENIRFVHIMHQYGIADLEHLLTGDVEPGLLFTDLETAESLFVAGDMDSDSNLLGVYRRYLPGDPDSKAQTILDNPFDSVNEEMIPHPELVQVAYGDNTFVGYVQSLSEERFDENQTRLKLSHYNEIYTENPYFKDKIEQLKKFYGDSFKGIPFDIGNASLFIATLKEIKDVSGLNMVEYDLLSALNGVMERFKERRKN